MAEIAEDVGLSEKTVSTYRSRILEIMNFQQQCGHYGVRIAANGRSCNPMEKRHAGQDD